jgi:hypothetical protein
VVETKDALDHVRKGAVSHIVKQGSDANGQVFVVVYRMAESQAIETPSCEVKCAK